MTKEKIVRVSLHNHLFSDKGYSMKDVADAMIEHNLYVMTIDGWMSPEMINYPYEELTKKIEKDEEFLANYSILHFDNILLSTLHKKQEKEIHIINSKEVESRDRDVQFLGYDGDIKHSLSLEETINYGLEAGCLVTVLHPGVNESKTYKFWSEDRFINKKQRDFLERIALKYQDDMAWEEFNSFLKKLPFNNISKANMIIKDFLNELRQERTVIGVYGNDAHIRSKKMLRNIANVYLLLKKSDINTTNSITLTESLRDNILSGNYFLSDKRYTPGGDFLGGFNFLGYVKRKLGMEKEY
jgi:hypothetical protein